MSLPVSCVRWAGPLPRIPEAGGDAGLDGRDLIADRLDNEVSWLRQAAGWLTQFHAGGYPPTVNLRPGDDRPGTANVAVGLARAAAVLDRIASDVEKLVALMGAAMIGWPGLRHGRVGLASTTGGS
ncbi:MAG: hypothetical protein ACRDNT_23635, partial [Streptosporangiaceae bacterium]